MATHSTFASRTWRALTQAFRLPTSQKHLAGPNLSQDRIWWREEGALTGDSSRFCRVSLGDTFQGDRYVAVRKLGYGQYSTVWLAKDERTQSHVALKVLTSDCYGGEHDIFELDMLQRIRSTAQHSGNAGRSRVIRLLDQFRHTAAGRDYVCFVFPVLGHHLGHQASQFPKERIPVVVMKEVARQLLQDLKPSNVLFAMRSPGSTIKAYLDSTKPLTNDEENRPPTDGNEIEPLLPLSEVISSPLDSQILHVDLRIIDFGVSSWVDQHLSDRIQSWLLRAPEVTLGAPWGTGVDIWSLGCLIYELVKGHHLFASRAEDNGRWNAEDDRLAGLIQLFGAFPDSLLQQSSRREEFFDSEGKLLRVPNLRPNSSSLLDLVDGDHEVLKRPDNMSLEEVPVFVDFLAGMLTLDPAGRKTAEELLRHPWLRS